VLVSIQHRLLHILMARMRRLLEGSVANAYIDTLGLA
jgi:hypothetical protein